MTNTLVVYFSRKGENFSPSGNEYLKKGHTEQAAEFIQEALNADIFEIETVKPYSTKYWECCIEAKTEAKAKARPAIKRYVEDISNYDTIFVCYPCWCGTAPMCVFTFLEHYDLTGKRIVPLCTHEGSGMGYSKKDLIRSCPGATVVSGLPIRGHHISLHRDAIMAWANKNQAHK